MNKITGINLVFLLIWGITSAEEKPSAKKILHVKRIAAIIADIPRQEIIKYLPDAVFQPDPSSKEMPCDVEQDIGCCRDTSNRKTADWIDIGRIEKEYACEDSGNCIYQLSGYSNRLDPEKLYYYYVKKNDKRSDSLILISCSWDCPDYQKYYSFLDKKYPYLDYREKRFNYLGNNSGEAAKAFPMKPFYWDENRKKYTKFIPSVAFQDSSSLLIYSVSGFDVRCEVTYASKPAEKEKKIILENLLKGIPDISCIYRLSLQKLATVDSVSRFIGQIVIANTAKNSWYIADIKGSQCKISVLEARDEFTSEFYCAYSFGKNNLPDVYAIVSNGDTVRMDKEIFYKTNNHWVCSGTQEEYRGDCLDEDE
ncbi:MAG: hypothetical protein GX556_13080 [Fibrobacter sp.]|nr:hypothetical protein [Fibrobacter sp.]